MKKLFSIFFLLACGATTVLVSCDKEADWKTDRTATDNKSFVRIVHASPSFRQVFNNKDSFNVFTDVSKINGTQLTYGAVFPSTFYSAIPMGAQTLRLSVNSTTNPDSENLLSIGKSLEAGKYYTLLITDSVKNANDQKRMWITDEFTTPDNGFTSLRLVHAVWDDTTGKNIDVYSTRRKANVFSDVAKGAVTQFSNFAITSSDSLIVRRAGTTMGLDTLAGASFGNRRVYTLVYRGTNTLKFGTKSRTLTTYNNL